MEWALRPQFSPVRWGDCSLLVIPLLRVIPRRGKLRKGRPPRHLPLPSGPHDPAEMSTRRTAASSPGARSSRQGHLGPPATGGWGTPRAAANPWPRKKSDRPAQAAGSGGGAGVRPRRAPHSPRSAPLCASASRRLRARPSAVQGSIVRDRTGRAGSPVAAGSLARSWAATRASALAGPGPRPREAPPVEAPPRRARSAAHRDAGSGRRAHGGPGRTATPSPRPDVTEAHSRGHVCTHALHLPFRL